MAVGDPPIVADSPAQIETAEPALTVGGVHVEVGAVKRILSTEKGGSNPAAALLSIQRKRTLKLGILRYCVGTVITLV